MKGRQTILCGWYIGVYCTLCQLMIMAWRDCEEWRDFVSSMIVDLRMRKRYMWLKMNDMEVMSGYEKSRLRLAPLRLGRPGISVIRSQIETFYLRHRGCIFTHTQDSLKSQLTIGYFVRSTLISHFHVLPPPSPENTKFRHPSGYLHAIDE